MDNAERAGVSNSVSVRLLCRNVLIITAVEHTLDGYVKLTVAIAGVYVVREEYLDVVLPDKLCEGYVLEGLEAEDVGMAMQCVVAERCARALLNRAEQYTLGLEQKLAKKGLGRKAISKALCYLEQSGELSDTRFAKAYLVSHRTRGIGRAKLAAALATKGIDRHIAEDALDAFYKEYPEEEMCRRALQKSVRLGKAGDALMARMIRSGFKQSMVRKILQDEAISARE